MMSRTTIVATLILLLALAGGAGAQGELQRYAIYLHDAAGLHLVVNDADGNYVESIVVREGDQVELTVQNDGNAPHNLVVCGDAPDDTEECDDRWGFTANIPPGESRPLTFTASKAGTYDVYCSVAGHKGTEPGALGSMRTTLVVQGEEKSAVPALPLAAIAVAFMTAAALRRK